MGKIVDIARTDLLSHDLPCFRCGRAIHTYLPCSDSCACEPAEMPGEPPHGSGTGRRAVPLSQD